jgi:hypothetical protein
VELSLALRILAPTITVWAVADATELERQAWECLLSEARRLDRTATQILDDAVALGKYA